LVPSRKDLYGRGKRAILGKKRGVARGDGRVKKTGKKEKEKGVRFRSTSLPGSKAQVRKGTRKKRETWLQENHNTHTPDGWPQVGFPPITGNGGKHATETARQGGIHTTISVPCPAE